MSYRVFAPDDIESISTPSSIAPSIPCSPAAYHDARSRDKKPKVRRVLGLLEYPTSHEDLEFVRDARDDFEGFLATHPNETLAVYQNKAIEGLDLLRNTFIDMCHIPPPECVFYQWAYRQSHEDNCVESGAAVFHLLYSYCELFDPDPDDNMTSVPIPTKDHVMTIANLVGCRPTSLMLAFGLRTELRPSPSEGRQIFWLVYNTLTELVRSVPASMLRTGSFLDRIVQLMSKMRALRGATGAFAHSGVFPSRTEVNYAMMTYATEIREDAEANKNKPYSAASSLSTYNSPGAHSTGPSKKNTQTTTDTDTPVMEQNHLPASTASNVAPSFDNPAISRPRSFHSAKSAFPAGASKPGTDGLSPNAADAATTMPLRGVPPTRGIPGAAATTHHPWNNLEISALRRDFRDFMNSFDSTFCDDGIRRLEGLLERHRDLVHQRESSQYWQTFNELALLNQQRKERKLAFGTADGPHSSSSDRSGSLSDTRSNLDTVSDTTQPREIVGPFNAPVEDHLAAKQTTQPGQPKRFPSQARPPHMPHRPDGPKSQLLQPKFGPPIPCNLMLPSLDQMEVVAPRPLRPMPPPLMMSPPGLATRMGTATGGRPRPQNTSANLAAAGVPPLQNDDLAQQVYERYHQQQMYHLALQKQYQEQDRMIQTYQQQQLQHRRQVLEQQAIMQKEHLSQLEFMQYQHQIHLLRSLRMQVRQQGHVGHAGCQYNANRDKGKSKDQDFDGYAELLQKNLTLAAAASNREKHAAALRKEDAPGDLEASSEDGSSEGSVVTDSDDDDDDWDIPILSRGDDDDVPYMSLPGRKVV